MQVQAHELGAEGYLQSCQQISQQLVDERVVCVAQGKLYVCGQATCDCQPRLLPELATWTSKEGTQLDKRRRLSSFGSFIVLPSGQQLSTLEIELAASIL